MCVVDDGQGRRPVGFGKLSELGNDPLLIGQVINGRGRARGAIKNELETVLKTVSEPLTELERLSSREYLGWVGAHGSKLTGKCLGTEDRTIEPSSDTFLHVSGQRHLQRSCRQLPTPSVLEHSRGQGKRCM
jgi:hypothetical protein